MLRAMWCWLFHSHFAWLYHVCLLRETHAACPKCKLIWRKRHGMWGEDMFFTRTDLNFDDYSDNFK